MSEASHRSSDSSSDEDGWVDENPEDDEEPLAVVSLLDDKVFPDAESMLAHCKAAGFDFLAVRDRLGLDFYNSVKLINFVRHSVRAGTALPANISLADIDKDEFLRPVLDDDALIVCLDSLPPPPQTSAATETAPVSIDELKQKNTELQAELESLTRQFANYQLTVQQTLDQRWGVAGVEQEEAAAAAAAAAKDDGKAKDVTASVAEKASKKPTDPDYYFESYAYNDIHETMLKDAVRTDAYRDFIYANKHLFAGKTVLDIGCGTGILSMFCAKAGAKLVIAVDRSEIINKARENVFHNGLAGQITCLKGLIEDVVLPVDQVDIIVSEWMGYALLYEAMLPSVLYARDRYLRPDGLLVPSHASLFVAPVCDPEYVTDSIVYWRDVYGFDMRAMQDGIYDDSRVVVLPPAHVAGSTALFRHLDLHTVSAADLTFRAPFQSVLAPACESLDGFLVWFDMYFATSRTAAIDPAGVSAKDWAAADPAHERVAFTTGPFGKPTHWQQCLLLSKTHSEPLPPAVAAATDDAGRTVSGEIAFITAPDNVRALTLEVQWRLGDQEQKQAWALK